MVRDRKGRSCSAGEVATSVAAEKHRGEAARDNRRRSGDFSVAFSQDGRAAASTVVDVWTASALAVLGLMMSIICLAR
jgi:hypothetical protein